MSGLRNLGANVKAAYQRLQDRDEDDEDSVLDVSENQDGGREQRPKRWWEFAPLCVLIILMLAPQYSILIMLVSYYIKIYKSPFLFLLHLSALYLLFFFASCSLIVCVVRDPGAVKLEDDMGQRYDVEIESEDDDDDTDILSALRMEESKPRKPVKDDPDFNAPHKWCRKCWAPKPERTHHCSACGRCVLKMDHHCPWLAHKCVGFWTYTAFLHFLACITLVSIYLCLLSGRIVYVAFAMPFQISETVALHALLLTLYGAIFALVVGGFLLWHLYLASTNQTTIENISPFLLLRYLPTTAPISDRELTPPPGAGSISLNSPYPSSTTLTTSPSPPQPSESSDADSNRVRKRTLPVAFTREYQLSAAQRRIVRYAHPDIRIYDVGFRANWGQLLSIGSGSRDGSRRWASWKRVVWRVVCGGGGYGDGKTFPRNPKARVLLEELAAELAAEERQD